MPQPGGRSQPPGAGAGVGPATCGCGQAAAPAGVKDPAREPTVRGDRALPQLGPARLSHELRTPLNAILGNTELLLDGSAGPLSSEARACLGEIQAAGRRMLRQVQALLDLCDARCRPAISAEKTIDMIELMRAAHAAALEPGRGLQVVPAQARYLVRGEPGSLGALAAAVVDLYLYDSQSPGPLQVTVRTCVGPGSDGVLRIWWPRFDPDQLAALPTALIEAILGLYGGVAALTRDGLELDWPAERVFANGSAGTAGARGRASS
jgi:hypothetical protein